MSTRNRFKRLFMGKLQFGGRSKGKNALRSVVALLAIVTMGGFLATNTDSIVAQQEDVEVELIVIGGTVPIIVGEFDTGSLESTQPITLPSKRFALSSSTVM